MGGDGQLCSLTPWLALDDAVVYRLQTEQDVFSPNSPRGCGITLIKLTPWFVQHDAVSLLAPLLTERGMGLD